MARGEATAIAFAAGAVKLPDILVALTRANDRQARLRVLELYEAKRDLRELLKKIDLAIQEEAAALDPAQRGMLMLVEGTRS
ncbi:MAG TPA: hypothetical protein VKX28_27020 [Xanthobacteraceae bacterium]|nr:hypothetical protein [Xanthobacteraceae bacterium]